MKRADITYEHGKAPEGAPLTWVRDPESHSLIGWTLPKKADYQDEPPTSPNRWDMCMAIDHLEKYCHLRYLAQLALDARKEVQSIGWHERFDAVEDVRQPTPV